MGTVPLPLTTRSAATARADLRGDCARCHALCCTVLGFTRSADFPVDKPAGIACSHLDDDHRCTIHVALRNRGYRGCSVYDCFGAGQIVSAATGDPHRTRAVFPLVRHLREMLWYLREAADRSYDRFAAADADALADRITAVIDSVTATGTPRDVTELHTQVRELLVDVSAEIRGSYPSDDGRRPAAGADLAGVDLRRHRLCGADLRGACLIGADLRDCDLTDTDLLGADLRDARIDGTDLSRALYVTAPQVAAARGTPRTLLPADIPAPAHFR